VETECRTTSDELRHVSDGFHSGRRICARLACPVVRYWTLDVGPPRFLTKKSGKLPSGYLGLLSKSFAAKRDGSWKLIMGDSNGAVSNALLRQKRRGEMRWMTIGIR